MTQQVSKLPEDNTKWNCTQLDFFIQSIKMGLELSLLIHLHWAFGLGWNHPFLAYVLGHVYWVPLIIILFMIFI